MVSPRERWTVEQANEWYAAQPWLVGANFTPSTAVNQLEMWQAETFDEETIDRELGWAANLGFNTVRVFLHDLAWRTDPDGFLERIDRYLAIADRHGIRSMLAFFDGVWDPFPSAGPQAAPRPHIHNSRWVQSPGAEILGDGDRHDDLEAYVKEVVGRFRDDPRIAVWDLFNEAASPNLAYADVDLTADEKQARAADLAAKAFLWARAAAPSQPLTAGLWDLALQEPGRLPPVMQLLVDESDVVTFHSYDRPEVVEAIVARLRGYGRPILCTEYMARPLGSTFAGVLPIFAREKIGAYNWGLVAGKTQTNYHWLSWVDPKPEWAVPWFHDVLHADGIPYDEAEAMLIRGLTAGRGGQVP